MRLRRDLTKRFVALALVVVLVTSMTSCRVIKLRDEVSFGVYVEHVSLVVGSYYRLNIVIYGAATQALWLLARGTGGYQASRDALAAGVPAEIRLSTTERALVCGTFGISLCVVGIQEAAAIVASWVRSDARHAADFPEGLRSANAANGRCFTDTLLPGDGNWTYRDGSVCKWGSLPK